MSPEFATINLKIFLVKTERKFMKISTFIQFKSFQIKRSVIKQMELKTKQGDKFS